VVGATTSEVGVTEHRHNFASDPNSTKILKLISITGITGTKKNGTLTSSISKDGTRRAAQVRRFVTLLIVKLNADQLLGG